MNPFDPDLRVFCHKCNNLKKVYTYCGHYYCLDCKILLGFWLTPNNIPSKWNDDGTKLIPLEINLSDK